MFRFDELKKEFNYKQNDFETKIGLTRNVIANLLNGRSLLDVDRMIALCDLFQVTPEYFLGKSNEGIYINVLGNKYLLSKEKFLLYKSVNKIIYVDGIRTLDVNSLDDIELVNGSVPYIKLKNEIL